MAEGKLTLDDSSWSTLSALYADQAPGTLNLDVDIVHRLIGGWPDEDTRTWDVILPQYHAQPEEIAVLEALAHSNDAAFHEVVLLDTRESAAARFVQRAAVLTDDHWIQHHHREMTLAGGTARLGVMYDDLVALLEVRPDAVVIPSATGAVESTYELLVEAVSD